MPSGEGRKGAGTPWVTQGPFLQHSSYSRYWTKKVKIRRQIPSYFMSPGSPELEKGRVPHCTGTSFFKSSPGGFWLMSLGPWKLVVCHPWERMTSLNSLCECWFAPLWLSLCSHRKDCNCNCQGWGRGLVVCSFNRTEWRSIITPLVSVASVA